VVPTVTWTFERRLLGASVVGWLVVAAMNLAAGPALGHDEAAFANVAQGDPLELLYRSRGVTALARIGLALGGAEWQLRLASAVIGVSVVLAVFAIARAVFDARTGAWAAAVIAGAHPMLHRSAELLGDLPATAGILAGMAALAGELSRPGGARWRIVLAAPAFAAAFYMRYGSAPVIAVAAAAALVLWWRALWMRPWPVVVTAVVFAALLIPHGLHSLRATGTLLGVLRWSSGVPRREYWGEGLVTYVTSNPFMYYGALAAPVMIAGLFGLARTFRSRAPWYLASVAVGQLLTIGIASHGQPRYVFVTVSLLVVLGVATLRAVVLAHGRLAHGRLALTAVGLAWLAVAITAIPLALTIGHSREAITAAAATIRAHLTGARCVVVARQAPQLRWYTHCWVVIEPSFEPGYFLPEYDRYVVSTPYGVLDGATFAAPVGATAIELPTGNRDAHVWTIR
jgi:hypothetical protein